MHFEICAEFLLNNYCLDEHGNSKLDLTDHKVANYITKETKTISKIRRSRRSIL